MTALNLFRHTTDVDTFAAGQVIFSEGDTGEVMYVVQEGDVDILVGDTVIDSASAGGIIGEMALLERGARSATARARTDCKLVPITEQKFTYLVQQTPHFALTVMRVMAERLRRRMAQ
jgi:CRP-like cAMP-binding protein